MKKIFLASSYQANANQNYIKIPLHQNCYHHENKTNKKT